MVEVTREDDEAMDHDGFYVRMPRSNRVRTFVEADERLGALLEAWLDHHSWWNNHRMQRALHGKHDDAFLWKTWMFWMIKESDVNDMIICVDRFMPMNPSKSVEVISLVDD